MRFIQYFALAVLLFGLAVWILVFASLGHAHIGRHVYQCKGGLIIHEWQDDADKNGQADGVRYFIQGKKKPFAEIYADKEGNPLGGVVNGKDYDSFEAMKKDWPKVCDAARASHEQST